ncbi:MAG TPA: hypothetical protein VGV38_19910, partial [Pyrinomonadaceae bacterium]|nr:hypothetical protein [Pyrinomonadaceae bacterium]
REASDERRRAALNVCRFVVAAVYFWSGVQKLNVTFFGEVWPGLVAPYAQLLPGAAGKLLSVVGLAVPPAEVFVGVGLLTRRLRSAAVVLAVVTHALVLALFVPVGKNSVVWPWNAASAAFVVVLFWRARATWRELLPKRVWEFRSLAVVLFGLLPALNFFGLWDSYLSSSLYSGATARASVMLGDADAARLPPGVRAYVERNAEGREFVSLNRWAYGELNVPPYPEPRVARRIARRLCADAPGLVLVIQHAPKRLDGTRRVERLGCAEL